MTRDQKTLVLHVALQSEHPAVQQALSSLLTITCAAHPEEVARHTAVFNRRTLDLDEVIKAAQDRHRAHAPTSFWNWDRIRKGVQEMLRR